ncbi:MAG: OOP family OmpA-OmpF porin [Patescibacteria group bacterium]|jgi:OOP family OmpA-OmpF porin
MKKVLTSLLILCFCFSTQINAQDPSRPNSIIAKKYFSDYHSPIDGQITDFGNYEGGFEVVYLRNMNKKFNVAFPLKIGVINLPKEENNFTTIGVDFLGQYQFYKEDRKVIPYLMGGLGGEMEDYTDLDFFVPLGAGINFRLGKYAYINFQSEFRVSFSGDRDNFHHGIGLGFMIGKITETEISPLFPGVAIPDTDGDGIEDSRDICPEVAGVEAFNGCPDTDGDGLEDKLDQCPNVAGPKETQGCPDADGDGIADNEDKCPNEKGTRETEGCPEMDTDKDGVFDHLDQCPNIAGTINGCPDTDGDGIKDSEDKCPNAKGEGRFNGCPDTDGDGIDDSVDKCPNSPAPDMPNGCPEIKKEDKEILNYAIQAVQFETGKNVLKQESQVVLDQVITVMNSYPDHKISIIGHTDNVGEETKNEILSINRARACYDFLVLKGINTNRIIIGGMGEMVPIADNDTEESRALNRRVEFKLLAD